MRTGLRVAERTQPVVVLLPRRVPQPQVDGLAVHHHVGRVVVEDGRDVVLLEVRVRVGVRFGARVGVLGLRPVRHGFDGGEAGSGSGAGTRLR